MPRNVACQFDEPVDPAPISYCEIGASRGGEAATPVSSTRTEHTCAKSTSYCPRMQCVNDEIAKLHDTVCGTGCSSQHRVDAYLYLCGFLNDASNPIHPIDDQNPTAIHPMDDPSSTATNSAEKNSVASKSTLSTGNSMRRMTITCICGNPAHTVVVEKNRGAACFPFALSHYPKQSEVARATSFAGRVLRVQSTNTGVTIPASAFISHYMDTIRFHTLPDIGKYIIANLQKRFYTPIYSEHMNRCIHLLSGQTPRKPLVPIPNISPGFVEGVINGMLCNILQDSIPCLKRAKKSPRNSECKLSPTTVELRAIINILYGTLMSVYPKSVKKPTFGARVPLAWRLHQLSSAPTGDIFKFVTTYPHIIQLSFMEYCMNFISEFMPCEWQLLDTIPGMRLYQSVCPTTCDTFRSDAISTGLESWQDLDHAAGICIDRCIRTCKFKMNKSTDIVIKILPSALGFHRDALHLYSTHGCQQSLRFLSSPDIPEHAIKTASSLHSNIRVFALPQSIADRQSKTVADLHSSCWKKAYAVTHVCFCCVCALAGKGLKTSTRYCTQTDTLSCTSCPPGSILIVNMRGVLLRVCNTSYYLCPSCTTLKIWTGDGSDFHIPSDGQACGCTPPPLTNKKNSAAKQNHSGTLNEFNTCSVCSSRHINGPPIIVPDVENRCIRSVCLCIRHAPPKHILNNVWRFGTLCQIITQHSAPVHKGRRR